MDIRAAERACHGWHALDKQAELDAQRCLARPGFVGVERVAPGMAGGAPDRTRTCNRQLRRLVLYPIELRALAIWYLPLHGATPTISMNSGLTFRGQAFSGADTR